jgi:hypothetical protein
MSKPQKISPLKLKNAYKHDLAAAWTLARSMHPDHTPYAFVLYGVEGPSRLWPCILTEESLTQVAQRYLTKGYHDTLDEARDALRYSIGDSPFVSELEQSIPQADALVEPHGQTLEDDAGYELLAKAAMSALKELDAQGLFGTGPQRERLLLVIITDDTQKDWSDLSARRLNPASVFERFKAETKVEGTYASCQGLSISSDGRSLYSAGSRANPDRKSGNDEFLSQLVAYDLIDRKLRQRWVFEFPSFGDSIRTVARTNDDQSIIALRAKYMNNTCHSILLRFPRDKNTPIAEHSFIGEPAGFALSPDGSRIAVALNNQTLHLFDAEFHPLGIHAFETKVYTPHFLRSGDLLMPTDAGVFRMNPLKNEPPTIASPHRAFRLATDANETLLAISRWFPFAGRDRQETTEFGVHLLPLPSFELLRTITIAGHQAVTPAISPDGRLLAFEAHEFGTPRKFVVIYDIATGKEICRRKSDFVRALSFLNDSKTLVMAVSRVAVTPPIDFWEIPAA